VKFVIVTKWFSGLGFAVRLQDEGHEVELAVAGVDDQRLQARYALVGNGLVQKRMLADVVAGRDSLRNAYFVWDENHSVEENECLRGEGFKVLGGGRYAEMMEHDRDACLEFVGRYGLKAPPSHAFGDAAAGVRFLEEHPGTAYVYKPDVGDNHETYLPHSERAEDANLELRAHLRSLRNKSPFVLQERKDGVEANVEVWFERGEPRFAFMTLEAKRRLTGDLGDLGGCAFDFVFTVPLDARAVVETVGRLYPAYHAMRYTGFGDANVVVARDGVWFFEKCERFGYNAHPNLLWNIAREPLGEILTTLVDGTFAPNFSPGFGASCTMYMDHPAPGKAIQIPDEVKPSVYFFDAYKEGDLHLTAGFADSVLLVNAFGYTIPQAWEAVLARAAQVRFPGRSYRLDGAGTDFPSSPIRRYEALAAMQYLIPERG
jgi:phosphoribosylamine-glycine ligase